MPGMRGERETPDRRVGGMSEAEKGTGKLHMLHEGEIVLNRPTTTMLLKAMGISKATAMKMSPAELMKRVKGVISGDVGSGIKKGLLNTVRKGIDKTIEARKKKAPARRRGGMARSAPARRKGGMSAPGTSGARAERDARLGNYPMRDTL